ncbi:MAG: InlB B-repeat-containing protein, partial [Oscillospiraceae bacterium]|nr:InlB B-repeat-containing protein [Oscillospiraceae bacterium]
VAAVDSEGISSPAIASGQAVPPATYVIKYDGNGATGGTAPASQNKTQYTDITLATNSGGLTRIGYRFTGWNTTPDGNGMTYPAGATYSADAGVTLYAQWEAVDAVDFTLGSSAVNHGATVTLTPPKSDATIYYRIGDEAEQTGTQGQPVMVTLYNGSYVPQDATGAYVGIPEGDNVTITAYAKYADGIQSTETTGTFTLKQYTVSYVGNGNTGGTVPSQQTFYSGGSVTVQGEVSLKKRGYTFAGWNTKAGGTGTPYRAGDSYTDDASVTLTAQWDPNTYTVRFDPNGGSGSMDLQQFTYDRPQQLTAMQFTRTDYEFTGWNTQANGSGTSYTDGQSISNLTTEPDGIVTLYAQWKIAVITLDSFQITSADALRTVLANYSNCKITVDLGGKQLEVTNSDLATNTEFFTVKDGNKVTITNGTVAVTGDFSTASSSDEFRLFSVKTGSTLDLSGCTLTGTSFGNAEGTAVEVSDGGSLTLTNTTISNFESNGNGAGVRVISGGSAIMNSGAIKNNNARYGAAMYLTGSFTMNGGEISGNTNVNGSSISGSGTFEWNGGTISNNQNGQADGGGVFSFVINYSGTMDKNAAS